MQTAETTELMDRLAVRVERETGLQFSATRRRDLAAGLGRMADSRGGGLKALAAWLLEESWDRDKGDLCARHLTVGETYFFREPRGFSLLCDYARARLAADPQAQLRLWSAGCCTGEEPYSMAIALREALPALDPGRVSILGTDLNPANLAHAQAGLYRQWSFRRTEPALRARYFTPAGTGLHALARTVREQVRFAQLNLALPLYPSAANGTTGIDIIFCRNVLMYFSRPLMAQVIARLRACLVDGGWLVVNPSEACAELFAGFTATYYPDAVFYQKTAVPAVAEAPVLPRPAAAPARQPATARRAPAAPPAVPKAALPPAPPAVPALPGPEAALRQAGALAGEGDGEAALHCLARAANQWPLDARLHQMAAQLALDLDMAGAARRHLQRLLYLDADSIIGHYLDGVALAALGRGAAARRAFSRASALLADLPDPAPVPGAEGWQAGALRVSVAGWLERAA